MLEVDPGGSEEETLRARLAELERENARLREGLSRAHEGALRAAMAIEQSYARDIAELKKSKADLDLAATLNVELQARKSALQGLAQASLAVTAAPTLEATLREVTQAARVIVGAEQAITSLSRGADPHDALRAVAGRDDDFHLDHVVPDPLGIGTEVCETNTPVRLSRAQFTARWEGQASSPGRAVSSCLLAAPLIGRDGRNLGFVQLSAKARREEFTAEDEAMLVQLAQLASIAIENTQTEADLAAERAKFKVVLDNMPIGVLLAAAPDGRIAYGNPRIEEILRRPILSSSHIEERIGWHPDGRPVEPEEWPLARALRGETVHGEDLRYQRGDASLGWIRLSSAPVWDEAGNVVGGVVAVHDIDAEKAADERQLLLLHELNHRVKNTLATIQSIATQTGRGASSVEDFLKVFQSRLMAIAHTHGLLTASQWRGAELHAIIEDEIAPYRNADGHSRVGVEGDRVLFPPNATLMAGLVFHELITNAAKYGALSVPTGHVAIAWTVSAHAGEQRLHLTWTESGGPVVEPPKRRGFGSKLIERGLAHELNGSVQLEFAREGLRCTMNLSVPLTS